MAADSPRILCFDELWQESEQQLPPPDGNFRRVLCLLSDPAKRRAVTQLFAQRSPQAQLVFVTEGEADGESYALAGRGQESWHRCFQAIAGSYGSVDGLLYLWPLENPRRISDAAAIASLLKALHSTALHPRRLLLAGEYTDGLQCSHLESWIGFERSIGLAWPGTSLAVLLRDAGASGMAEMAGMAEMEEAILWPSRLWDELNRPGGASVLYRHGKRHLLAVRPAIPKNSIFTP